MRILIAHPLDIIRQGLCVKVAEQYPHALIIEADNAQAVIDQLLCKEQFDMALIDYHMFSLEEMKGVVGNREDSCHYVWIKRYINELDIEQAQKIDLSGVISTDYNTMVLKSALGLIMGGECHFIVSSRHAEPFNSLTRLEQKVLALIVAGKSNKQIQRALNMTERRNKQIQNKLYKCFKVTGRVPLAVKTCQYCQ
ncbi:hypothetical protein MTBPR1_80143 [Candidatus Terasakiella magnetica]|uniref:HTH luxR-type domain-containing protein n=1 Tax=Candidatus Terasakiella magnetica TaxID=1867952 RepID=A0A1C3RLR8_9PROT|nr:LuxR C-terminal-related transcriptional regulator [Candidatus Terasakiella magnetica]SCA58089.1 hypothetical protein MTBPR1_80143 [Candidatus Terasakiella magnetica]